MEIIALKTKEFKKQQSKSERNCNCGEFQWNL